MSSPCVVNTVCFKYPYTHIFYVLLKMKGKKAEGKKGKRGKNENTKNDNGVFGGLDRKK